jgi:hypothetical protein
MKRIFYDKRAALSIVALVIYATAATIGILTTKTDYFDHATLIFLKCVRAVPYATLMICGIAYNVRKRDNPRNYVLAAMLSLTVTMMGVSAMGQRIHAYWLCIVLEEYDMYDAFVMLTLCVQCVLIGLLPYMKRETLIKYLNFLIFLDFIDLGMNIMNMCEISYTEYFSVTLFTAAEITLYMTINAFAKLMSVSNTGGALSSIFEDKCPADEEDLLYEDEYDEYDEYDGDEEDMKYYNMLYKAIIEDKDKDA